MPPIGLMSALEQSYLVKYPVRLATTTTTTTAFPILHISMMHIHVHTQLVFRVFQWFLMCLMFSSVITHLSLLFAYFLNSCHFSSFCPSVRSSSTLPEFVFKTKSLPRSSVCQYYQLISQEILKLPLFVTFSIFTHLDPFLFSGCS